MQDSVHTDTHTQLKIHSNITFDNCSPLPHPISLSVIKTGFHFHCVALADLEFTILLSQLLSTERHTCAAMPVSPELAKSCLWDFQESEMKAALTALMRSCDSLVDKHHQTLRTAPGGKGPLAPLLFLSSAPLTTCSFLQFCVSRVLTVSAYGNQGLRYHVTLSHPNNLLLLLP